MRSVSEVRRAGISFFRVASLFATLTPLRRGFIDALSLRCMSACARRAPPQEGSGQQWCARQWTQVSQQMSFRRTPESRGAVDRVSCWMPAFSRYDEKDVDGRDPRSGAIASLLERLPGQTSGWRTGTRRLGEREDLVDGQMARHDGDGHREGAGKTAAGEARNERTRS